MNNKNLQPIPKGHYVIIVEDDEGLELELNYQNIRMTNKITCKVVPTRVQETATMLRKRQNFVRNNT